MGKNSRPVNHPLHMTPDSIAFIASDRSGYTSGSVVTIDAGLSARAQAF